MEIKEEEAEREWEQQTSLALRRSRFRDGHAAALEFGPSPVTTTDDDDDDDAPQHIPPHFNTNGSVNPNSMTNAHTDHNGVVDHMVARFDHQNIAASTAHAPARLHNDTHTHSISHTSVYYDTAQGNALNSTYSGEKQYIRKKHGDGISVISAGDVSVEKNLDSILDHPVDGNNKGSNLLSLQHSEILSEEYGATRKSFEKNEIEVEDVGLINKVGLEVTEIDLERVLEKQNTHDLYCPNCNSCITRRVILRKRKRGVRITSDDVKRNKLEIAADPLFTHGDGLVTNNQIHNSAGVYSDGTSELAGKDYGSDGKPDIFRCLSCFSFFIPSGNGFEIFRMFENKIQTNVVQDQQKPMKKSWISSIFASRKEPASASGSDIRSDALTTRTESSLPSSNVNGQSLSKHKDLSPTRGLKGSVESGIAESQEDGHYFTKEQLTNGEMTPNTGDNSKNAVRDDTVKDNSEAVTSSQTSLSNISIDVSTCHQSITVTASADEKSGTSQNPDLTIQYTDAGKDTVIVVEPDTICNADSQISLYFNVLEETEASPSLNTLASATESRGADDREAYRIEIIKSIVFGGLIESMTSLGVVSSAAGASTATLNILALGLANLLGGLVLILHNLWDLKKYKVAEQRSRYEEVLGRRENFLLHATVVNLSFLMFGLIPPITYGFSFRKSDVRELKLLAAAAASIAGIFVLATGKAYARKPPKSYLKTIVYYVALGFTVSGVSFAVGELINRLLEKLHFQLNSQDFATFPLKMPVWASY